MNSSDNVVDNSTTESTSTAATILPPFLAITYEVIGTVGIVGNLFVIIVIVNSELRRRINNILIIHQATIDALSSILLISSSTITTYEISEGMWAAGSYCAIWLSKCLLWAMMTVSTFNLVLISLERCLSMVQPIWHKVSLTHRKMALMMTVPWIIGLGYPLSTHLPVAAIQNGTCKIDNWPDQQTRSAFGVVTVVVEFFVPLTLIIYCYSHIAIVINRRVKIAPSGAHAAHSTAQVQQAATDNRWSVAHKNTLKTMLLVSSCFVVCWTGNSILYLLVNLRVSSAYNSPFYHFTVIMVFLNCCVNPFIYSYKYEQFRRATYKLLPCCVIYTAEQSVISTVS